MPDLVAFDLETTGLSPRTDRIVEIGATRFTREGEVLDRFDLLVDPATPLPIAIQRLTGIHDDDLVGGPSPAEGVAMFADFAEGALLVAHGSAFDLAHCAALLPQVFGNRVCFDTLELARILLPGARSHSLPLLARALGISHDHPHRAGSDAAATADLLLQLSGRAERLPAATLLTIRELLVGARTPLAQFFSDMVSGIGDPTRTPMGAMASAGHRNVDEPRASELAGAVNNGRHGTPTTPSAALADAAARALGPEGALWAREGFTVRDGQIDMARAVAQTLDRSGRLLVEAGTGTGKSLGYLVPLVLWHDRTGGRAVVATHTTTLQEQLADRELPALAGALGSTATAAMLKGRQHYISLRRWRRFLSARSSAPHAGDVDRLRFALRIVCWLAETETGDRSELRLAGPDEQFWREVQSHTDDCLGSSCANWRSGACFMVAARRRAAAADVVVVNHALLVADAERQGQVLTPFSALVVDEAQHLEESATRQLGVRLRLADVLCPLDQALAQLTNGEPAVRVARAREAAQRLFGDVRGLIATTLGLENPGNATLGIGPALEESGVLEALRRAARAAIAAWRDAATAVLEVANTNHLQASLLPDAAAGAELSLVAATLADASSAVERILLLPPQGTVRWLELRAEQAEIHEAPTSVDQALRETVFDRADAVVLTSATLSVAGRFDFIAERTGIGGGASTLVVSSPFNYLEQALTVVCSDVPAYDDDRYEEVMAGLITGIATRLGGRTLVLFTGYAPLRAVHSLLRARLEPERIALLGQGLDGTRRQILESFSAGPRSVLLGTGALWEGIDLPGDQLQCVVIAKIPFPVPTDPLIQARGAGLEDPFAQLALPVAVLRLKQGFGRLIRTREDRGAVVLCDRRIASREYGPAFLAALPEASAIRLPVRDVPGRVEDFVRRGTLPLAVHAGVSAPADDEWEPA